MKFKKSSEAKILVEVKKRHCVSCNREIPNFNEDFYICPFCKVKNRK